MLSYIILALIIVGYVLDFKRTLMVVVVLSTWIMHFSLLPNATLFQIISVLTVFFYISKKGLMCYNKMFPFGLPILIMAVSLIVTTLFSGGKMHFFYMTTSICVLFLLYIFWDIIRNNKECLKLFANCTFVYGVFVGVYALFETIFQINPIVEYFVSSNLYRQDFIIESIRFGVKRSQSIFSMHTTSGAVCITIAATLFYLKKFTSLYNHNKFVLPLVTLLSFDVFFTGARSAIICYAIILLSFVPIIKKSYFKYTILLILFFVIFGDYFNLIIDSLQDTQSVAGSNAEMRNIQFAITQHFFQRSPWIGNGLLYTFEVALVRFPDLLGAESIWFTAMIDMGILGVICHVLVSSYGVLFCVKRKSSWLSFYVIGFLVFFSLSSIPCFEFIFPLFTIVYMLEVRTQFGKIQKNIKYGKTNTAINYYSCI